MFAIIGVVPKPALGFCIRRLDRFALQAVQLKIAVLFQFAAGKFVGKLAIMIRLLKLARRFLLLARLVFLPSTLLHAGRVQAALFDGIQQIIRRGAVMQIAFAFQVANHRIDRFAVALECKHPLTAQIARHLAIVVPHRFRLAAPPFRQRLLGIDAAQLGHRLQDIVAAVVDLPRLLVARLDPFAGSHAMRIALIQLFAAQQQMIQRLADRLALLVGVLVCRHLHQRLAFLL